MRSLNVGTKVVGAVQQGPRDAWANPVSLQIGDEAESHGWGQTNTGRQGVTGWMALGLRGDAWGECLSSLV